MERAKKMVLISKEQLERIQREGGASPSNNTTTPNSTNTANTSTATYTSPVLQTTQTIGDNLTRLDDEMRKILDSNTYTNDHDRLKDYLRTLQRYLFFVEEKRKALAPKDNNNHELSVSNGMSIESIVQSVPKLYRQKAQLLLNHLKNNSDRVTWDETGVVYIDGEKIKNSNIVDLINDTCRNRKSVKAIGRKEFATLLGNIATPHEFIGNPEIWGISKSLLSHKKKTSKNGSITEESFENASDLTPLIHSQNSDSLSDLSSTVIKAANSSLEKRKKNFTSSTPEGKESKRKTPDWLKF